MVICSIICMLHTMRPLVDTILNEIKRNPTKCKQIRETETAHIACKHKYQLGNEIKLARQKCYGQIQTHSSWSVHKRKPGYGSVLDWGEYVTSENIFSTFLLKTEISTTFKLKAIVQIEFWEWHHVVSIALSVSCFSFYAGYSTKHSLEIYVASPGEQTC